jgi:multiple sugar transport system ATP-binding protein
MADQIIVMNKGVIQQIGSPHAIYYQPTNLFVANFIGSPPMNFLKFRISQTSQDFILYSSQMDIKISKINLPLLENIPSEIILGIRPKDIMIDDKNYKKEHDAVSLKGKLLFTELLGDEVIYEFKLENNSIVKVSSNTDNFNYKQNDEFNLIVKYKNIHFFDPLTEQRLF